MHTPAQVLADLLSEDPTRPAITFYDDTPGPTQGERIELSRKVLDTWVAKAANALQEGLDVEPGSVVLLDLPVPHWRWIYWSLAVWSVGATLTLDRHEGADVLVTAEPDSPTAEDADEVIAVSLPALAREFAGDLRSGVMDEAKELPSYGDSFTAWDEPEPDEAALIHDGQRTAYESVVPATTWAPGCRVLVTAASPQAFLHHVLHAFAAGGSVVVVRGSEPNAGDDRMRSEGVDLTADG
ncbi:TIGR03089 family protein [Ornithinicoccus hortensis]|uniref:TIGR03089 family protein n=1 Tax=Ornithinicoccus hortensis TaxID=82346 RepID=UPI001478CDF6|nr:TIGR03089 family protein [Ornithinicoccus hortensis]